MLFLLAMVSALLLSTSPGVPKEAPASMSVLFPGADYRLSGYEMSEAYEFVPQNNDPQLLLTLPSQTVSTVTLLFSKPLVERTELQVFYAGEDEGFSENRSVKHTMEKGARFVIMELPSCTCAQLRVDVNGSFALEQLAVSSERPAYCRDYASFHIDWARVVLLWFFLTILCAGGPCLVRRWKKREPPVARITLERIEPFGTPGRLGRLFAAAWPDRLLLLSVFALTLLLALRLDTAQAPDEWMRSEIPLWIFFNGRLPTGGEPELVNNLFGFSYGFLPHLPGLLAQPFLWLFYAVSPTEHSLLLALRMVSVLAVTGCAALGLKIGRLAFRRKSSARLFTLMIAFLPQTTFLGCYHNNDAFALFSCLLIFYYLLRGRASHWSVRNCIGLGVGFSCCMLTYYNACVWIFASVPFCVVSCLRDGAIEKKGKTIARRGLLIMGVVLLLAGWFYVRNAVLHEGDLLGLASQQRSAELCALAGREVFVPTGLKAAGISLQGMLFGMNWIFTTLKSLIAVFGNMYFFADRATYFAYYVILCVGALFALLAMLRKKGDWSLALTLVLAMTGAVALSVFRSYVCDFQPQGRYIFPALPGIAYFAAFGFEEAAQFLSRYGGRADVLALDRTGAVCASRRLGVELPSAVGVYWLILYAYVYMSILVPELIVS